MKAFNIKKPVKMKFDDITTWIMGLLSMASGCFAFIGGMPLKITWSAAWDNAGDTLYAVFIAAITALTGMFIKQYYDAKLKEKVDTWFKKKKKNP